MPDYRRWRQPGGSYFFTVNLLDRRRSLLVDHILVLRRAFASVMRERPFVIDAAVILPDHLHTIWTLPPGDSDFSTRWRLIKSRFTRGIESAAPIRTSRRRHGERAVWQRRFWEHLLRDEDDYAAHVDYIHFNPLKHGLVERPIDWPYSSIHRFIRQGIIGPDWGTSGVGPDMDLG